MAITYKKGTGMYRIVRFLAEALIKSGDSRKHVTRIRVEEDRSAVATNGASLHWVKESGLGPGYYVVTSNTKKQVQIEVVDLLEAHDYPDYKSVLADADNAKAEWATWVDCENDESYLFDLTAIIVRKLPEGETVNFNLLRPITEYFDDMGIDITQGENGKPICFSDGGDAIALVMPKRMNR